MAVSSTVDGSVVIGVDMNVSDAEKELAKLKKKIENIESQIKKTSLKRSESIQRGGIVGAELDAEKAKLQEIKDRLADIRAMAKDTSLSKSSREDAKSLIQVVQAEYTEQRERVRGLQTEFNKLDSSVQRYDQRLQDLNNDLNAYKTAAGGLVQEIDEGNERFRQMAEAAGIADQHIIDLNRELSELSERQKELESAGIGFGYEEYDQNAARIAELTRELKEYQKALTKASAEEKAQGGGTNAERSAESQNRLNSYLEKSSSLYQKLSSVIGKTAEASSILQDMAARTGGKLSGAFQTASTAIGGMGEALTGVLSKAGPYLAIAGIVIKLIQKMNQYVKLFETVAINAFKKGADAVASFGASVARNFVAALKAIGKFGETAFKAVSTVGGKIVDIAKNLNVFSKISDTLSQKFKRLGSTIKSALVFSVIYKGLSMLRQQMGAYLSVNTQFMTALRRLQGVLLTAFQPIYEVIVPALTTLINVLTHAAATIAQFFASLFGTTAKRAQANAESLYNQATATTAVGEAAEEASKQLASFDEINKLEGNQKAAGGGGATSVDMGPLFDYEYEETPFDSWCEAFSAFLDKLLDGIPKLRDKFKDFADWLNNFAKKLYDMFTFPGVLDKVKKLGRDLADALNDLVNWIDWEMLGRALGAGLNLALNFLTSFLYRFDWMNLGRKLAEFVNGLVDEIDWYEFGRLLWAGFKIALETLAGFLDRLDMPLMAKAASNIILGFFDEMEKTIRRIPWFNLGRQIAKFLNEIQWYEIITSVFNAIRAGIVGLVKLVRGFINTLDWDGIAEQIYTAVNDSTGHSKLFENLGKTLGDLFIHAFDFARDVIAGINWHQLGEDIASFILGFDFVGALGSLADLIAEGINAAVQLACGFLDKIMPEAENIGRGIAERIRQAVEKIKWDDLGRVIGNGIKTALSFVAGLLDPETFYAIGKAIGDFLVNLDWPGIVGGLAKVLANAIASAVAAVRGFLDSVGPHLKQIATDIAQKINEFVRTVDWEELGRTIGDGIKAALDFMLTLLEKIDWMAIGRAIIDLFKGIDWGALLESLGRLIADLFILKLKLSFLKVEAFFEIGASIINGIKEGILRGIFDIVQWLKEHIVEPIVNGVKNLLGIHSPSTVFAEIGENLIAGLLQGITRAWQSIVDFFTQGLEALKTVFSTAWEAIKSAASAAWDSIKSALEQTWNSLKESASSVFNSIKDKISEIWKSVKETTTSVWNGIKSALETAWNSLKEKASAIFTSIKDKIKDIWTNIKETTSQIWNTIKSTLSTVWSAIKSAAETSFNAVKDKIISAWNKLKTETVSKWNEIKTTLSNAWNEIKTNAFNKFQEVKQAVIDKMSELKSYDWMSIGRSIVDGFLKGLESIWNSLTSWAGKVKDTISNALSGASSSRGGGFSGGTGYGSSRMAVRSMPDISTFHVPALAQGAVIPPNREFLAVLGDQRSGTNIEAPLSTIEQAVANVMNRMGGSNRNATVILQIEGRELGRAVVDFGGAEYQRIGTRLVEART